MNVQTSPLTDCSASLLHQAAWESVEPGLGEWPFPIKRQPVPDRAGTVLLPGISQKRVYAADVCAHKLRQQMSGSWYVKRENTHRNVNMPISPWVQTKSTSFTKQCKGCPRKSSPIPLFMRRMQTPTLTLRTPSHTHTRKHTHRVVPSMHTAVTQPHSSSLVNYSKCEVPLQGFPWNNNKNSLVLSCIFRIYHSLLPNSVGSPMKMCGTCKPCPNK